MSLKTHVSPHGTVMAVSMMKDEAPYLLEWFAHHLALGFTDILVYTNDCSDGTDTMLERLEELGLGHHRRNNIPKGIKPQPSALKHAQNEPLVQQADWVMVFDADEFLCIKHGDGTIDGMLNDAVARGANGIVVTWRIFGSGDVVEWSTAPVTEQYLYAAPPLWNKGWGVKTLFKFDPEYWKLGIHRPKIKNKHIDKGFPDQVHWLNGSGEPLEDYFKFRGWRSIRRTVGYDWVQMNHYALKSVDSYALRKMRGNVNNKGDKYNTDYWALQDRNEVRDDTILRHAPKRKAIMDQLLQDPVLHQLHHTALDRVSARLDQYKSTPEYTGLVRDLELASDTPIADVEAKPPKARDPKKIAALMSDVERRAQTAQRPDTSWAMSSSFLSGEIPSTSAAEIERFQNHAMSLPADAAVFTPEALSQIVSGKYARKRMRRIHTLLSDKDRLLCLGDENVIIALQAMARRPGLIAQIHTSRSDIATFAKGLAAEHALSLADRLEVSSSDAFANTKGHTEVLPHLIEHFKPTVLMAHNIGAAPLQDDRLKLGGLVKIILTGGEKTQSDADALNLAALAFREDTERSDRDMRVLSKRS